MMQGKMLTDSLVSLLQYLAPYNRISYACRKGTKERRWDQTIKTSEAKKQPD